MREKSASNVTFGRLLDGAIRACVERLAPAELPFVLLEDIFETQSIMDCEETWVLIENRVEDLTSETFVSRSARPTRSKLTLLRIANSLLRRLSQTHNTVFCGKIMMLLAYAFSLSERSGVNLLGSHNEDNETTFETENEFEANVKATFEIAGAKSKDGGAPVDYTLYRAFWGIQGSFASKPGAGPNGCFSSYDAWQSFCDRANLVWQHLKSALSHRGWGGRYPCGGERARFRLGR